jgi:hypothetical protein
MKDIKWNTTEVFSAVVLVATGVLAVLYVVFWQQYSAVPSTPPSSNQLSKEIATLVRLAFAGPVAATLIGYRDAFARLIAVGGQAAAPPTIINSGAPVLYFIALSGIVAAAVLLIAFRFGIVRHDADELVGTVAAWWGATVSWALTRYVQIREASAKP